MDLIVSWVVFPAILAATFTGCGLLVEQAVGARLRGALLAACGLALVIVVGQFCTLGDATAELTVPVVVAAAVAGWGLAFVARRTISLSPWLLAALLAVFAVYAAPIVLSGETTLAGFIKLDDTATWLTFTDRIMDHGRDLSGLDPSTYRQTLLFNIGDGYPIGAFVPFGTGVELSGVDASELIQPYMAFTALLITLAAWELLRPLVTCQPARAGAVAIASQPALLYGYFLWGGIKEISAAALIATAAGLASAVVDDPGRPRRLLPLVIVSAALVGILSPGGLIWLLPILIGAAVMLVQTIPPRAVALRAFAFGVALALLALPVVIPGGVKPPTSSSLSDADAQGNLIRPLGLTQIAGIWPMSDFRLPSSHGLVTGGGTALVFILAAGGVIVAWRRRALGILALALGGTVGCVTLILIGSPWVEGKAMATASPFALVLAMAGAAAVSFWLDSAAAAIALAALIGAGVVWSNALEYGGVSLAPHDQFKELEEIADVIGDAGPTLMTEYSPYGARHFLRDASPESVSELRYRSIPLANGKEVDKGFSADTDELDPSALSIYRTLVLRRSPTASRPPGAYDLIWDGRFYDAWQRAEGQVALPERMPLGARYDPVAIPDCDAVEEMAARAPNGLVAATGVSPVVIPLSATRYPRTWRNPGVPSVPIPSGAGSIVAKFRIARPDRYEVWLGESVRPEVDAFVDGEEVGSVRHELNNYGQYVAFGTATLDPGPHTVELRFHGPDLHPGSGGLADPVGPLVLSGTEANESRLVRVSAEDARDLCGREWDWIEAG